MSDLIVIGDIHGKFEDYFNIISAIKGESIQVGDFGLGFGKREPRAWFEQHRFIRGNHDDPSACRKHNNYLGEYGVTESGVFFVGGGYSIDYEWRIGHNAYHPEQPIWWEDEEIAEKEFSKILKLYEYHHPKIVVSHDCPSEIRDQLLGGNAAEKVKHRNRTSDGLLSAMFKAWQPDLWVFGHYHLSQKIQEGLTLFVCLDELETYTIKTEDKKNEECK